MIDLNPIFLHNFIFHLNLIIHLNLIFHLNLVILINLIFFLQNINGFIMNFVFNFDKNHLIEFMNGQIFKKYVFHFKFDFEYIFHLI